MFRKLNALPFPDSPDVTVVGAGVLRVDFGVESAAWVEFDSADLGNAQAQGVNVSIGESTQVCFLNIKSLFSLPLFLNR